MEELASDGSVDVVHVCTPNHLHFPETESALRAGKHVMCEKPLAMDTRQSAALIELARKHNRVGGVAHNLRYYPLCQEARALVERGLIGEPRLVHGGFCRTGCSIPRIGTGVWNQRWAGKCAWCLISGRIGSTSPLDHRAQSHRALCRSGHSGSCPPAAPWPVETFQKRGDGASDEIKITNDDYAAVLLHFEGSLRGVMTVSQVSAGRKCNLWFEVDGSEGSLAWMQKRPTPFGSAAAMRPIRLIKDPALMSPEARGYAAYPGGHAEGYPDTFAQLFKDFYAYIAAGDFNAPRTFPTFETGHYETRTVRAHRCERTGTTVGRGNRLEDWRRWGFN